MSFSIIYSSFSQSNQTIQKSEDICVVIIIAICYKFIHHQSKKILQMKQFVNILRHLKRYVVIFFGGTTRRYVTTLPSYVHTSYAKYKVINLSVEGYHR